MDGADIALITFIMYRIILMLKGTRAVRILLGLAAIIFFYFFAQRVGLVATSWLLSNFLLYAVLIVVIIFQNEIRRALWEMGRPPTWFDVGTRGALGELEEIIRATQLMVARKVGALIVIERQVGLRDYIEGGVTLDARASKDLLLTLFLPGTPLHDGAVIIQKGRVAAASCLLPLSHESRVDLGLGTRHRAAVGLTEETDAVVIVVSEERGSVSLAVAGELRRNLDATQLREQLYGLLTPPRQGRPVARRAPKTDGAGAEPVQAAPVEGAGQP